MNKLKKELSYRTYGILGLVLFFLFDGIKMFFIFGFAILISLTEGFGSLVSTLGDFFYKNNSIYAGTLLLVDDVVVSFIFPIFGLIISILLIKKNTYSKNILSFFYAGIGWSTLFFFLNLPLKRYLIVNLLVVVFSYFFVIKGNNPVSRIIKGEKQV